MMTSSNGSIFRVTGPFCGEFTEKNSWVNNDEAGDFRRRRAHCEVTVMRSPSTHQQAGCCNKLRRCCLPSLSCYRWFRPTILVQWWKWWRSSDISSLKVPHPKGLYQSDATCVSKHIPAHNKEKPNLHITGILFPSQRACNVKNNFMSWRHHVWPCVYAVTTASRPIDWNHIDSLTQDSTVRVPSMTTHLHISQRYLRMLLFVNKICWVGNVFRVSWRDLTKYRDSSRCTRRCLSLPLKKKTSQQWGHFLHEKKGISFFFHFEKEISLWIKGTIVQKDFSSLWW